MKKPIKPKAPALPSKLVNSDQLEDLDPMWIDGEPLASFLEQYFPGVSLAELYFVCTDRDYDCNSLAIVWRQEIDNPEFNRQMELYQIKKEKYDKDLQKYKRDVETYYRAKVAEAEEDLRRLLREGE